MPEKTKGSRRRSTRLKGYDYSQAGAYFVTMCVRGQQPRMGSVKSGQVNLSPIGRVVEESWRNITNRNTQVELDTFIVMPNHLHGILLIHNLGRGEAFEGKRLRRRRYQPSNASPLRVPRGTKLGSLGAIVQSFKSVSTRRINQLHDTPGERFWQRGFYDRIIRNREELDRIRKYVSENPLKWELDEYHPSRAKKL